MIENLPIAFIKSEERDRFYDDIYALGAYKIKRIGDSVRQRLSISFVDDERSEGELQSEIKK